MVTKLTPAARAAALAVKVNGLLAAEGTPPAVVKGARVVAPAADGYYAYPSVAFTALPAGGYSVVVGGLPLRRFKSARTAVNYGFGGGCLYS